MKTEKHHKILYGISLNQFVMIDFASVSWEIYRCRSAVNKHRRTSSICNLEGREREGERESPHSSTNSSISYETNTRIKWIKRVNERIKMIEILAIAIGHTSAAGFYTSSIKADWSYFVYYIRKIRLFKVDAHKVRRTQLQLKMLQSYRIFNWVALRHCCCTHIYSWHSNTFFFCFIILAKL